MTWEQFEKTGAVEDYLRYKGIAWKEQGAARASCEAYTQSKKAAEYGTVDNGDRHGAGGISLR